MYNHENLMQLIRSELTQIALETDMSKRVETSMKLAAMISHQTSIEVTVAHEMDVESRERMHKAFNAARVSDQLAQSGQGQSKLHKALDSLAVKARKPKTTA
jgi:hypothetical protein